MPEDAELKIVFPKTREPGPKLSQIPSIQELDNDKPAPTPPAAATSRVHATTLVRVNAEASKDTAVIYVEADGALQKYKSHIPSEDPPRIVFDFPGIRSPYKGEQRTAVKTGPVSQVRHFAHPDKVRLVIETQQSFLENYTAEIVDKGLLIRVGDAVGSKSKDLKPVSGPAPSQALQPVNPALEKAGSPAQISRFELVGEPAGKSALIIGTTRPVQYELEKVDDKRVNLRLLNTIVPEQHQRALITKQNDNAVDRVTPGRGRNESLVAIDLRENVPYAAEQDGNTIRVNFAASAVPPRPNENAEPPSSKTAAASASSGMPGTESAAVKPAATVEQKNFSISGQGSGERGRPLEITIDQAVEIALQKNRSFQTARRALSAAASSYRSALSQYYPTISGGLTGSYSGSHSGAQAAATGIDKLISSGLEIGASLPLDISGAINRSVQQALNSLLISKAQYVSASQDLVVVVYSEYYSAVRGKETIAINMAQVEYARDQLKIAEANLKAGRVPEVDVLTAKVQLRNEEQNLKASEGDYEIRLANLKNTLLLDQQTKIIPVSKMQYVPGFFEYEASIDEGMQKRLEVKIAELNLENAKIALKSSYDPYRPTLNVTGSYGYAVSGPNASDAWDSRPDEPSWAAAASISIPIFIFDGGATRESITRANISVSQAQSDLDQVKDDIQLEIRNELTALENSSERVKIMQDSAALAKESLRITEIRYQLGKTSYLELTNARNNLRQSEVNYLDSLIEYNLSKIRFDRALGRPLVQ